MSTEPSNPLAAPQPDWTPPSADVEISQDARDHAMRPVFDGLGKNREPTAQEINDRLVEARNILGEAKFWGPKSAPPPTHEQRQESERLELVGVRPGATGSMYALNLPAGVAPEAADMIKGGLAALEFTPAVGTYLAQRIADLGAKFHGMSDADKASWSAEQNRILEEWGASKGWDLEAKKADVRRLLSDRKVPELIGQIMASDFDMFARLAMHAEHLRSVKR
jgi:hypothetical protein